MTSKSKRKTNKKNNYGLSECIQQEKANSPDHTWRLKLLNSYRFHAHISFPWSAPHPLPVSKPVQAHYCVNIIQLNPGVPIASKIWWIKWSHSRQTSILGLITGGTPWGVVPSSPTIGNSKILSDRTFWSQKRKTQLQQQLIEM